MAVALVLIGFVSGTFLLSAATKIAAPQHFDDALTTLTATQRLGGFRRGVLRIGVPLVEVALGCALLFAPLSRYAIVVAVPVLAVFFAVLASDERPSFTNCGCGSAPPIALPRSAYTLRTGAVTLAASIAAVLTWTENAAAATTVELMLSAALVLPLAVVILEAPLIRHIVEVDRQRLPERVRAARLRR